MKRFFRLRCMGHRSQARLAAWVLACLTALPLSAYYPFLHLRNVDNQWIAAPERFDLREQPGGAVPLVVTRGADLTLEEGEAWESVVSEVKLAGEQWSRVPKSALRLRYAGEMPVEQSSEMPHVQVLFDELAPGVLAMGGPVETDEWREDTSGAFKPIKKSMVIVNADLRERPSYGEAFFMTLMHEMGHALGLQHTFTSSVMSTGITRSTTKAAPLAADDHAGIAALYPNAYFHEETGVIRGRVTLGDEGLHFASVTALAETGEAVSTLTLPDGSYEIQGVPPGDYQVYAQAVPESNDPALGPGQIVLPQDDEGHSYAPGQPFATRFFPDAAGMADASLVRVPARGVVENIDITVQAAAANPFRGATTYSFPGDFAVNPAQVNRNSSRHFLLADGEGLTENGQKTWGLSVDVNGTSLSDEALLPYPWATNFLQINVDPNAFESNGPKTVQWTVKGNTYVQPAAFHLLDRQPPRILSVMENVGEDGNELQLVIRGEGLDGSEQYIAEGLPTDALVVPVGEPSEEQETVETEIRIPAPYTGDGRQVRLVALGSDGQSSLHLDADGNRVASRLAPRGNLRLSRPSLEAGTESLVYIEADGPVFAGSRIGLDFGTPSVVATRIWKLSETLIAANIAVGPGSYGSTHEVTVHNDLALIPGGSTITVMPSSGTPKVHSASFRDALTLDGVLYPGSIVQFQPAGEDRPTTIPLALGERAIEAMYNNESELYSFQVPLDFPLGLTELFFEGNSVGVEIAPPPPAIVDATAEGRTKRLQEALEVTLTIRAQLELPEEIAAKGQPATVRMLVGGRLGQHVAVELQDGSDRVFNVTAETLLREIEADEGYVTIQIDWGGRLSSPFNVPLSRGRGASAR